MEARKDLRVMRFTQLLCNAPVLPKTVTVSVSSAAKRLRYPIALGAAMLMLGLAAGPLSAQEYWPPDEPSPADRTRVFRSSTHRRSNLLILSPSPHNRLTSSIHSPSTRDRRNRTRNKATGNS